MTVANSSPRITQPHELAAFISDVYATTHHINNAVAEQRGEVVPAQSLPSRNMMVAAISHTLTAHALKATEGSLAAVGERTRQHIKLLEALGEVGLQQHLSRQLDWLVMRMNGRAPNGTPWIRASNLDYYRWADQPASRNPFFGLGWAFRKNGRAVRRMLRHVVFSDSNGAPPAVRELEA